MYDYPLYRPPSEAGSLILQLTLGCSHNGCRFCYMYKDKSFRVKDEGEIEEHINWGQANYPNARRIFLADGNVLAMDAHKLGAIVQDLYQRFPNLERVGAYAGPKDLVNKTSEELALLRQAGLKIIYMGIESGSDKMLDQMNKGVSAQEMITAGQKAVEAGFVLSCMLISGLGGKDKWREHALESAKVVNAINPDFLAVLTLMTEDGTLKEEIPKVSSNP